MSEYLLRLRAIKLGIVQKEGPKEPKPLKKISEKKAEELKAGVSSEKLALDKWFEEKQQEHFGNGDGVCMECGSKIPAQLAKHATAHLLPKKIFKSVACYPTNYLILGAGCGCHYKTDRLDQFVKMDVWPEAAKRIKEMLPLLPFEELQKVSSQLLKELDKINT